MKKYQNQDEWQPQGEDRELVPYVDPFDACKRTHHRLSLVWGIVCIGVAVTFALLIFALLNATPKTVQSVQLTPPDASDEVDWRGAFAARNIYEECYESAVTVRLGRDPEAIYWSGFVIDADGWIITSLDAMDHSKRGKLFVSFNDGREYSVESIFTDNETGISLLKISADKLNAVELRQDDVQGGEALICISALEYGRSCVLSGEMSGVLDDNLKVNIGLDGHGVGAPLFDDNGLLVGMAVARGADGNERLSYAVYATKCVEILEKIK